MRGKVLSLLPLSVISRITPAHAGKSENFTTVREVKQDHPRTCGEKRTTSMPVPSAEGSPPHMRGKAKLLIVKILLLRITPAHAGKSYTKSYRISRQ